MSQLSISHQDLAVVLDLALLTDDLSRDELKAVRETARRLDQHRNWMVTGGQNDRVARPARTVPCTFSDHHLSGRAATRAGMPPCRCSGDGVVPDFTDKARGERLTDDAGWSRAAATVDELHGPAGTATRVLVPVAGDGVSDSNPSVP